MSDLVVQCGCDLMVRLDNNLVLYFLTVTPLPHVISNVYRAVQVRCVSCFSIWTLYGQEAKLRSV